MVLTLITWVVLGLIIGAIGNMLVDLRGDTPIFGIAAAVGGAVVLGFAHAYFSGRGVITWDLWSLIFVAVGAATGALLYHMIRGRSIVKGHQSVRYSS